MLCHVLQKRKALTNVAMLHLRDDGFPPLRQQLEHFPRRCDYGSYAQDLNLKVIGEVR